MKVSELTGEWLDFWVAKAEGHEVDPPLAPGQEWPDREKLGRKYEPNYIRFSTDWKWAGPIIERERIAVIKNGGGPFEAYHQADFGGPDCQVTNGNSCGIPLGEGSTYLIAGMRAFVASKFGEELPDPS